jgi:hypothetical protein
LVYQRQRAPVLAFLDAVQTAGDVHVIRLDDELCTKTSCNTSRDGIPLYHDNGHLSVAGSIYLAKKISLLEKIQQTAR